MSNLNQAQRKAATLAFFSHLSNRGVVAGAFNKAEESALKEAVQFSEFEKVAREISSLSSAAKNAVEQAKAEAEQVLQRFDATFV